MRRFFILALCAFLAVLPACSMLTPQQRSEAKAAVQREYVNGNLTAAQRDAAIEALDKGTSLDWQGLGLAGLNILLALVGGPIIVRRMRGPPTQLVGLPETKIRKGA